MVSITNGSSDGSDAQSFFYSPIDFYSFITTITTITAITIMITNMIDLTP